MTGEQLIEMLRRVDAEQADELDRIATAVRSQSRELLRALVKAWAGSDPELIRKASLVIGACEELHLGPLLDARDDVDPVRRVWRLRTGAETEMLVRERVVRRLEALYDDRTPVPMPEPMGPAEEPQIPRRMCDEAYLLVRRMLNPHEGPLATQMNAREFLALPDREKDAEIARTRQRRVWTRFVEGIEG